MNRWWRPPRLRSNEPGESSRRATWLELFYDLVYVLVVAALAAKLAADLTLWGVVAFAGLFVPVWWSWSGVTFYNDRFDTDDAYHRLVAIAMMLGAVAMTLSIPDAFTSPAFALSYVALRVVLIGQYLRVARHVPSARPLALRYASGFGLSALLWVGSLALPEPWTWLVWAVAMVIDIGTPLTARRFQAMLPVSTSHLPERIGLFTIIVLGEAVAAVVHGAHAVAFATLAAAALGLTLAASIWWVYFENLDEHVVRRTRVAGQVWFYAHLPLVMGITATAVGVEHLVHLGFTGVPHAAERWVLAGGFALSLVAMGAIHLTTRGEGGREGEGKRRAAIRFASAGAVLLTALVADHQPAVLLGGILAAIGVAQIALDPPRVHHGAAA